jgi:ParB-like chromosome segregation protein Spo0J
MHIDLQNLIESAKKEKDPFTLAGIFLKLRDQWEYPLSKLATEIGKHPSYVSSLIRVNLLPEIVKDGYYAKQISESHLIVLSRLNHPQDMREAYEEVLKNNLSLAKTQILVRKYLYGIYDDGTAPDLNKSYKFAKDLQRIYEAKVNILQSRATAKIVLEKKGNVAETSQFIALISKKLLQED